MNRRELMQWLGAAGLGFSASRGFGQEEAKIDRPILFNTPEADAILEKLSIFPPGDTWHQDISRWPKHADSDAIVDSMGGDKPLRCNYDMNFVIVPPDQRRVAVAIESYPDVSDRGPFPVPNDALVEGWPFPDGQNPKVAGLSIEDHQRNVRNIDGDRHMILVDPGNHRLHEFFYTARKAKGWTAAQASTFDLALNTPRPEGWTSADAAGLPIFPAVVRYDELKRGRIDHALRLTAKQTRNAFVWPARHFASKLVGKWLPRMGERFRLRADFDTSRASPTVRVILDALKRHGAFMADNGIDWAMSIAPDPRIPIIHDELRRVKGSDFEVVIDPAARDYRALRGRWSYARMSDDGKDADASKVKGSSLTIGDHVFQAKGPDGPSRGVLHLDATRKPKWIDISVAGSKGWRQTSLGLYELKEGQARIILAPPGKPRPGSFESAPGSGLSLRELKREA